MPLNMLLSGLQVSDIPAILRFYTGNRQRMLGILHDQVYGGRMNLSSLFRRTILTALAVFCLTGCFDMGAEEDDGPKDVSVRNASSYTVSIRPGARDKFQPFSLRPGGSYLVMKEDQVGPRSWAYHPFDRVYVEEVSATEIVFRTR